MSMYPTPAVNAAEKTVGTNLGSTAFSRNVMLCSLQSSTIFDAFEASILTGMNLAATSSLWRCLIHSITSSALLTSKSATTMTSKNDLSLAILAIAAPTPPAPTSKILIVISTSFMEVATPLKGQCGNLYVLLGYLTSP